MKRPTAGAIVDKPTQRRDGSPGCTVRIPYDHPTHGVGLTDENGVGFQVDYDVVYRAGRSRTVLQRQEPDGSWTSRITGDLEPPQTPTDAWLYAGPE